MEKRAVSLLAFQKYCQLVEGLKIQEIEQASEAKQGAIEARLLAHAADCLELPPEAAKFLKSSGASLPAVKSIQTLPWSRCFYGHGDTFCFVMDEDGDVVTLFALDPSTVAAFEALLAKVQETRRYPAPRPFEILVARYKGEEAPSNLEPSLEAVIQWISRVESSTVLTRILLDTSFMGLEPKLRARFPRFQIRYLPLLQHLSLSGYTRQGVFSQMRQMLLRTPKPYAYTFVFCLQEHAPFVLLPILDAGPGVLDDLCTEAERAFPVGRVYACYPKAPLDEALITFLLETNRSP